MQFDTAKKTGKENSKKVLKKTSPKKTQPKITFTGKPSCRSCCRQPYRWKTRTYINYCPNCKKISTLKINPKGVPEKELTCSKCSSDFCICGHDKTSGKRHYTSILKRA